MLITPVFIGICILFLLGMIVFGDGMCKRDGEHITFGIIILIVSLAAMGVRSDVVEKELINTKRYDLCVKEGKEVVKVLGHEMCKL